MAGWPDRRRGAHPDGRARDAPGRDPARTCAIVAVCRSGGRSASATEVLVRAGYTPRTSPAGCRPGRRPGCRSSRPAASSRSAGAPGAPRVARAPVRGRGRHLARARRRRRLAAHGAGARVRSRQDVKDATTATLIIVGFSALAGSIAHRRRGTVRGRVALGSAPPRRSGRSAAPRSTGSPAAMRCCSPSGC